MNKSKYDIDFFKRYAQEKGGNCLSSEYKNGDIKLLWRCKEGHEWMAMSRKILEGSWCPDCHYDNCRIYKCNDNFFARDTEESFYVAGFWAADGWVNSKGYGVGMSLARKDLDHLIKIRDAMGSDIDIKYFSKINIVNKISQMNSFIICSKYMHNDIQRFNVVPQKTYIYDMPEWLKTHSLVHHFIRGYIDGDGCFNFAHNKKCNVKHVNFSVRGTAKFLTSLTEVLTENNVIKRKHSISPKVGAKYACFDKLQCSGNRFSSRLYDFLYHDATIYLERKYDIISKAPELLEESRKIKKAANSSKITKELLFDKAKELGSNKKIAEYFNCTTANISFLTKHYGIRDEINKIYNKKIIARNNMIIDLYKDFGKIKDVSKESGISKHIVSKILKDNNII